MVTFESCVLGGNSANLLIDWRIQKIDFLLFSIEKLHVTARRRQPLAVKIATPHVNTIVYKLAVFLLSNFYHHFAPVP